MSKRTAKKFARHLQHGSEQRCVAKGGHNWARTPKGVRCAKCGAYKA